MRGVQFAHFSWIIDPEVINYFFGYLRIGACFNLYVVLAERLVTVIDTFGDVDATVLSYNDVGRLSIIFRLNIDLGRFCLRRFSAGGINAGMASLT